MLPHDYTVSDAPSQGRAQGESVGKRRRNGEISLPPSSPGSGMRVGTALEPRKIGKVFHGDARHGNVERARYTEKHGFDPAAWCLSLSIF